jgi:hypothetical protein
VDQERVSGVASPTSCDDETMAVALEALLIPTDVRDHSGRSGLSAFGLACLLRDARLHNPLPLLEFRDVRPNGRQRHLRQHLCASNECLHFSLQILDSQGEVGPRIYRSVPR